MEGEKPQSVDISIWFSFGMNGRELYFGLDSEIQNDTITIYSLTQSGEIPVMKGDENPIEQDSLGHFIASVPASAAAFCKKYNITRADIGYIMATGYNRKILEAADDDISEITAHAYGVRITAPP